MLAEVEEAAAQKRVGAVLGGKWRLDALLGMGGVAWVYSATHRNQSRAAVKLLKPERAADAEARRWFLREGYVANSVGHPGVRVVLDDDEALGTAYLVMELLSGKSLGELRVMNGGRLPARAVLEAMAEVLEVLAAAHERRIVHRDIKPHNLFLTDSGAVKVLDFGIAEMHQSVRASSPDRPFMGSPAYSAPEQVNPDHGPLGPATDLWAVGASMFHLLSGQYVHHAPSAAEQLYFVTSGPPRSLQLAAPDLPRSVIALVDRALAFHPRDRFPDARSMHAAVRAAHADLDGLPLLVLLAARPSLLPPAPELTTRLSPLEAPTVQTPPLAMPRCDAADQLAELGITGSDVYLLDTIPLLEMIWADGEAQESERRLLDEFLEHHVQNVNELCERTVVSLEQARSFVDRFLRERPDPELLALLRRLFVDTRLDPAPASIRAARRQSVLDFCLDLGAACVAEFPQGDRQRFCRAEKALFEAIVASISGP